MIKKITTGRFADKYLVRTSTRDQLGHRKFSPRKYVDTLEEAKIIESEDRIALLSLVVIRLLMHQWLYGGTLNNGT